MNKILMSLVLLSISLCAGPVEVGAGVGVAVVMQNPTSKQQVIDLCTKLCPQVALNGEKNRNEVMPIVVKSCIDKASSELKIK
ncbi:MAG: hypothetical protein WC656_01645 [Sulfurimonas sp.]|jgi:hypothetical protein